jgi:hypothetical protein
MTDAANNDTETTTSATDDKGDVQMHPNSMNPHVVPETDDGLDPDTAEEK